MEAICARRQAEVERRNAQIRTNGLITEEVDKKILARLASKDFLKNFKRTSLGIFQDMGILRSAKEFHMGFDFVPKLIGQAEHDNERDTGFEANLVHLVGEACSSLADKHKTSIHMEKKRRHDAIQAEKKRLRDEVEAKRRRKERRNALREAYKLRNLQDKIREEIIQTSQKVEYGP